MLVWGFCGMDFLYEISLLKYICYEMVFKLSYKIIKFIFLWGELYIIINFEMCLV